MITAQPKFSLRVDTPPKCDAPLYKECIYHMTIDAYLLVTGTLETWLPPSFGKPPQKTTQTWTAKILPQRFRMTFKMLDNSCAGCRVEYCSQWSDTNKQPQPWSAADYIYPGGLQVEVQHDFACNPVAAPEPTVRNECLTGTVTFSWLSGLFLIGGDITTDIKAAIDAKLSSIYPNINASTTIAGHTGGGIGIGGIPYSLPVQYTLCCCQPSRERRWIDYGPEQTDAEAWILYELENFTETGAAGRLKTPREDAMASVMDKINDEILKEMNEYFRLRRESDDLDARSDRVLMPGGKLAKVGSPAWNEGIALFNRAWTKRRQAAAVFEQCKGKYKIAMIVYRANKGGG